MRFMVGGSGVFVGQRESGDAKLWHVLLGAVVFIAVVAAAVLGFVALTRGL